MSKDKITPFNKSKPKKPESPITLDSVREAIEHWRSNKNKPNEKMPAFIWDDIFVLLKTNRKTDVIRALAISWEQLRRKEKELASKQSNDALISDDETSSKEEASILEFCEATYPLDHKPAKAFDTTTSVVEFCRSDGMLMKIHICTDRFDELINAFSKGHQP